MQIDKNTVVALSYELKLVATGDLVDEIDAKEPLQVLFGKGHLIPDFEENIKGLQKGENFKFNLQASSAFGDRNESSVIEIPKSAFLVNGEMMDELLIEGQYIPIASSSGTEETQGLVVEIREDNVLMDFNHPLAGQEVVFEGTIENVRIATPQELKEERVIDEKETQN
ncbi:MAG: peptidylprolyl isomerase [Cytophagales bacterium]|nr:peptidylprolyl isomerase [Cytophagales bacterium]